MPSSAASHPPLSHFFSLRLLYLPHKSPQIILLCHLMNGLFVSQPNFPFQVCPDLEQRPCRSPWRAFASTHPLMLPFSSPREALLACSSSLPWNLPSFTTESTISLAKVQLSLTLTLSPLTIWYSGLTTLYLFLLANTALTYLLTALSVALRQLFFSAEACAILQALCWSWQQ